MKKKPIERLTKTKRIQNLEVHDLVGSIDDSIETLLNMKTRGATHIDYSHECDECSYYNHAFTFYELSEESDEEYEKRVLEIKSREKLKRQKTAQQRIKQKKRS
jgi:hypothetical protein